MMIPPFLLLLLNPLLNRNNPRYVLYFCTLFYHTAKVINPVKRLYFLTFSKVMNFGVRLTNSYAIVSVIWEFPNAFLLLSLLIWIKIISWIFFCSWVMTLLRSYSDFQPIHNQGLGTSSFVFSTIYLLYVFLEVKKHVFFNCWFNHLYMGLRSTMHILAWLDSCSSSSFSFAFVRC